MLLETFFTRRATMPVGSTLEDSLPPKKGGSIMNTPKDEGESNAQATVSTEGRRVIGQAIIDGLLSPDTSLMVAQLNYNQAGGNYTQRGGGNYTQNGGGNYDQAAIMLER